MNSPQAPDHHPDDEALSVAFDTAGQDAATDEHIARCQHCRARLDQFAAVAGGVGGPVADASGDRADRAVGAARAAWAAGRAGGHGEGSGGAREPAGAPPVPLDQARRRRPRAWALGVAAAAALALGAGSLVVSLGDGDGPQATDDLAAAPEARDGNRDGAAESLMADAAAPTPSTGAGTERSAGATASGPLGLPDLGERADLAEIAAIAGASLPPGAPAPARAIAPENADQATTSPPCATEAAAAAGVAGQPPGYAAGLRYQGEPAVVFAFAAAAPSPDGSTGGRAVVMAIAGCRLLGAVGL